MVRHAIFKSSQRALALAKGLTKSFLEDATGTQGRVPIRGGILSYASMNTKYIPLLLIFLIGACAGLALLVGSFRPFADTEKFSAATPQATLAAAPVALGSVAPSATPPQATFVPTPLASRVTRSAFVITRSAFAITRSAQAATSAPTISAPDSAATETAAPAQATFDAIATRALATPNATRPSNPARAIHHTTNFLLVGADTRATDPNWKPNTDVMMILFLDTANQRAAILSLPRDLVVAIPGHQAFRINAAYHYGWDKQGVAGGITLLKQVLRDEFDIRIDHWALIDFNGLNKIVDTLGGIQVTVPCALSDTIDDTAFTIPAGEVQMDYLTTKRYVQSRYTTSDTSRNFRQQRVIWAMMKKALSMNAPDRVPALYEQVRENVATDMTLLEMVSLVPAVYQLDLQNHPERLRAQVMQAPVVYPWVAPSGAWLYLPDYALVEKMLNEIFDAPQIAASKSSPAECPEPPPTPTPTPTEQPTATPTP